MSVDFDRERQWWDAKASREEVDTADEAINRALRWREIERHLDGVHAVLDVGGGTGAFSIPLAQRGFAVTHVDFSPAMLDIARRKAQGLTNIRFVEANAIDLSHFADRAFDLVLNMDGAISFCGQEAERSILESVRLTRRRLIMTVSHRAWMVPVWTTSSVEVSGRLLPSVWSMLDHGEWRQESSEDAVLANGLTQNYLGVCKAFLPGELREVLERGGMRVLRLGGLGSLAGLCGEPTIGRVSKDEALLGEFLDLCERFDREIMPDGPGTRQRAGLIAVAEPASKL